MKSKVYLKMITMAICETNMNRGNLRKVIWNYLLKEFSNSVDYRDFLLAIRDLIADGRLINKMGHFFVQDEVV